MTLDSSSEFRIHARSGVARRVAIALGAAIVLACSDGTPHEELDTPGDDVARPAELKELRREIPESSLNPPLVGVGPALGDEWEGEVKFLTAEGGLFEVSTFRGGIENGPSVRYYPDGTVYMRRENKDGKVHGTSESYYPNGSVLARTEFLDGVPHGLGTTYWPNGERSFEARSVNGKRHGEARGFLPSGKSYGLEIYENGEPIEQIHLIADSEFPPGFLALQEEVNSYLVLKNFWLPRAPAEQPLPTPDEEARIRERVEGDMREAMLPPIPY